jgi:hypothetical protein
MGTFLQINYSLKKWEWIENNVLRAIRNSIPNYFGYYSTTQFDSNKTEREVEQNTDIYKLKDWKIIQPLLDKIIENIQVNFDINTIDYITFTPDSWNKNNDNSELKWFSIICKYISEKLNKPIILPEIVKTMVKQKTLPLKERINNRRWAYSFNKNIIEWKNILFLDDVITTGVTMCAIWEDIVLKWGFFLWYWVAASELDSYNQ